MGGRYCKNGATVQLFNSLVCNVAYSYRKQGFVNNENSFRMFEVDVKHDYWYFILMGDRARIVYLPRYLRMTSETPVRY